jgi:hypothetical protein
MLSPVTGWIVEGRLPTHFASLKVALANGSQHTLPALGIAETASAEITRPMACPKLKSSSRWLTHFHF